MRHIDLFSGIGGFSLAASWVWGEEHEICCFVEIDEFCQKVLRKHWPDVPIVEDVNDIEQIVAYANSRGLERSETQRCVGNYALRENIGIDLLTAGFPCPPVSCAGQRKGTEDDRWLWPQTIATIRHVLPRWCLIENVPGLLTIESGLLFEQCCLDLENANYTVWSLVIPACGVGAPHRRDRVWIVAHCKEQYDRGYLGEQKAGQIQKSGNGVKHGDAPHTEKFDARFQTKQEGRQDFDRRSARMQSPWNGHWYEAATRLCRVDDGLPGELDGHRKNRLKALGNSIVPQVATQIMLAIKTADEALKELPK